MTDTQKTLAQHMSDIMSEVGYVQKDARNDHFKYKYASADAVLTKVREACTKRGIGVVSTSAEVLSYENQIAVVRLTQAYSTGVEQVSFQGLGSGKDSGDKAIMKANTAALKYLLSLAFNISWGDDPEADSKTDAGASKPKSKGAGKPAAKPAAKKLAAPVRSADEFAAAIGAATEKTIEAIVDDLKKQRSALGADFKKLRQAVIDRRAALAEGESK